MLCISHHFSTLWLHSSLYLQYLYQCVLMDFLHSRSLLVRGKGTSKKEKDNDAVGGPRG